MEERERTLLKDYVIKLKLDDGTHTVITITRVFDEREAVELALQKFIENEIIVQIDIEEREL